MALALYFAQAMGDFKKTIALVDTRHVTEDADVVAEVDDAIVQVDEVVTASTDSSRRPGVEQRPACGSKCTSAFIIDPRKLLLGG